MKLFAVLFSIVVLGNCDSTPSGKQVKKTFIENEIVKDCNVTAPEKIVTVCDFIFQFNQLA